MHRTVKTQFGLFIKVSWNSRSSVVFPFNEDDPGGLDALLSVACRDLRCVSVCETSIITWSFPASLESRDNYQQIMVCVWSEMVNVSKAGGGKEGSVWVSVCPCIHTQGVGQVCSTWHTLVHTACVIVFEYCTSQVSVCCCVCVCVCVCLLSVWWMTLRQCKVNVKNGNKV